MSQFERALKQHLDLYMEEQRRLHKDVMTAAVETRIAASEARGAAERIEKSGKNLEAWVMSIEKRVQGVQRWQAGLMGAGAVAGAVLWDKAKRLLGLT